MVGFRFSSLLYFITAFFVTAIFIFSTSARADVLFEGYSKILSGGVHVGYAISRYEFDTKKKQFISTSFLKINEINGGITESLKAFAAEDLKPISYSYTSVVGTTTKIIDAKADGNKLNSTIKEGGKVLKNSIDIPKGAFLSTFLVYVILKSPKGLSLDQKYNYSAIAEEDGKIEKGLAVVRNSETFKGLKAFRVLNEFKGTQFISYVTEKGEVLSTSSPVQSIGTELVASAAEATAKFQVSSALLNTLFGAVPEGKINTMTQNAATVKAAEASSAAGSATTAKENTPPKPNIAPGAGKGFIDHSKPSNTIGSGEGDGGKSGSEHNDTNSHGKKSEKKTK